MAQAWVMTVAGQRLHDTIFRQPAEAFLKERLRPHHGRPPVPSLHRAVSAGGPDGLVTVETHRDSVPPAYVGRTVEVHWSPESALQISHQGTLIATHPRPHGQHLLCVDPAHYQALRRHLPTPSALPGPEESLALTTWTGRFPEVVIRPLACYEALISQEVAHDSSPTAAPWGTSPAPQALAIPGAFGHPAARGQCPRADVCRLP